MEKEIKYVAPEALILSAQVERGVYSSGGDLPGWQEPGDGGELS